MPNVIPTVETPISRQYVGARYVPIFDGAWDNTKDYAPLTVVSYQGNSYTSRTYVPSGTAITNETYWALTGNYNAQVEAYRQEVLEYANKCDELSSNFKLDKLERPHTLHGNLILDYFHDNSMYMQGACYVGSNKVVAYFSTSSDIGVLVCFNISTNTIVWSHNIKGYHGNSVCYRSKDNCVYIAGCYASADTSTLINKIVVVSMYDPTVVAEEITAPVEGIYSIAYDESTDTFYSINARGTTTGEANRLFKYAGIFESVDDYIDLDNYPAINYHASTQGIQFAKDGIVYTVAYSYNNKFIIGNDVTNGKVKVFAKQPNIINNYRVTGESQALIYDFDNDEFYIGASSFNTGYYHIYNAMLYKIDLFKGIDIFNTNMYGVYGYDTSDYDVIIKVYESELNSLYPYDNVNVMNPKTPNDALTLAKVLNKSCSIYIYTDTALSGLYFNGFRGSFNGNGSDNKITIKNVGTLCNLSCQFVDVIFDGSNSNYNMFIALQSKLSFLRCEFNDDTDLSGHIYVYHHSDVYVRNDCVFHGSARKFVSANGSTIRTDRSEQFVDTEQEFSTTADTYVYTGLAITVEQYQKLMLKLKLSAGHSYPKGIIVSRSSSQASGQYIMYKFEPDEQTANVDTPLLLLPASTTVYIWAKYSGSNTEKVTVTKKDIEVGYNQ